MAATPEEFFEATPARHGGWREGSRPNIRNRIKTGNSAGTQTSGVSRHVSVGSSAERTSRRLHWQFRTFRGRLATFIICLLVIVLGTTLFIVRQANHRSVLREIESNLRTGARVFSTLTERRMDELTQQAWLLSSDYAFKQAFGTNADDPGTIRDAMQNWSNRINATFMALVSLEGVTLYDSAEPRRDRLPFDLPSLIAAAEANSEARGLMLRDGELFVVVVVPLQAPETVAWISLGFRIDDHFASELGAITKQEVSLVEESTTGSPPHLLASTLSSGEKRLFVSALRKISAGHDRAIEITLSGRPFITLLQALEVTNGRVSVAFQRNLTDELASFRKLELTLALVGLVAGCISLGAAAAIARSVSRPLLNLAQRAHEVESGNYSSRPGSDVIRADEVGQLARSFHLMTAGLAERDKVRDLLGKVTSPAVAAELTRQRVTLGGEEKMVTILFCDLRDFTALSEGITPARLLELLNTYFTRMSEAIDTHGGIVDKYIGDALMALFGAPLPMPDQQCRALEAALDMRLALQILNHTMFAKDLKPLQFGIGIHTAVVVAGNVGSPQRYNYTVLGDGVNIASRLQTLTRRTEFATDIIVSEPTLSQIRERFETRSLGQVSVKGKQQPVGIYALVGQPADATEKS
jgi:adenylate cyclase